MRDRRDIRARRAEGGTIRGIARDIGADRNTIRRALAEGANLDYQRPSLSEEFEPAVRDVLADYPRMSVAQIGELIEWPGSRRMLSDLVAQVRPSVLEREREDLNRPVVGTAHAGPVASGRMLVGRMDVGRVDVDQEASGDPGRAADQAHRRSAAAVA